MRSLALLLLGVASAGLVPASATAQDGPTPRPVPVVFTPAPGDAEDAPSLAVTLAGLDLCLAVGERTMMPPYEGPGHCRHTSLVALSDPWLYESRSADPSPFAGGAVDAATAIVRYELRGGRTVDVVPQVLPALRGESAGRLRFFALRLPAGAHVSRVLLLGADGVERAESIGTSGRAWDDEAGASIPAAPFSDDERALRSTRPLAGRSWHVRATLIERASPRPGFPLAREREICVRPHTGAAQGSRSCVALSEEDLTLEVADLCEGTGDRVVGGIALQRAGRVRVELGDGRILRARTASLATLGAPHLIAYGVAIPQGTAVRALRFDAAAGGWGHRAFAGLSPRASRCDGQFSVGTRSGEPVGALQGRVVVTSPGAPDLHVAETEDRICVQLTTRPEADACRLVPGRLDDVLLNGDVAGVSGVVDARIRSVHVRYSDGTLETIETLPPPDGAGPVASLLRYVVIGPRPRRAPLRFTATSTDGLTVEGHDFHTPPAVRAGRTFLRIGPWRLRGDVYRPRYERGGVQTCLRITRGGSPPPAECSTLPFDRGTISVDVRCDVRRAVLVGAVGRGVRRVTLRLSGGRDVSVPLRRLAEGGRGWIAVPPGTAEIAGVDYRDRRGAVVVRTDLPLPPAARQCGYSDWVIVNEPYSAKTAAAVSPPLVPMNDSVMITR